jgi:hypothetical protein
MERCCKGLCGGINTCFVVIQQSLNAGTLVFEWNSILLAALAGGVAYLTKTFFTAHHKNKVIYKG